MCADVVFGNDGSPVVTYRRDDGSIALIWISSLPSPNEHFIPGGLDITPPRLAISFDTIWMGYSAKRDDKYRCIIREVETVTHGKELGEEIDVGPSFGEYPICLSHHTGFDPGMVAWQSLVSNEVCGRFFSLQREFPLRDSVDRSGLSRISNRWPVFISEDMYAVKGMIRPAWANGCVVGETDRGVVARIHDLEGLVMPGQWSQPRVASRWDGMYVAVAHNRSGISMAWFTALDLEKLDAKSE